MQPRWPSSREHVPEPRTVPLCGNSIGTDRRFLARYLPELEEYLHYRSVDVSTVKELARRWYPEVMKGRPDKDGRHRALDDITGVGRGAPLLPGNGLPPAGSCRRADFRRKPVDASG